MSVVLLRSLSLPLQQFVLTLLREVSHRNYGIDEAKLEMNHKLIIPIEMSG